ncbi:MULTISPECIES: hypothetical protein [Sphingobacterium]|uniref:hypothetical protein n=1 Tax=Sphingobacterium TaxID=28453 RepID=UPI000E821038|nr:MULTISPECIES: hypothetical protein [Sphingobacterium]HAF35851.1 hypothetical protein [Sphingobacterium sp.]QQT63168.1 hypothetical protein I6I97_05030 [Sphingobacterium multivorum]HAL54089.1 hypothetical protein [Sphingobacterium sp.]HAT94388.1 hypothetical protein [Sphingobacterium sp.]HAU54610.1 hypothetical protein [Sphingobacterium sp.]
MKTESIIKTSYSGMMYSYDFQLWYTYLKRRIQQEWRQVEVLFLLARLRIYPRHLKNVLYGLIQQNKLIIINVEGRYSFYPVDRKEGHAKFN